VLAVAGKGDGEIQYPSTALVKNLNILAASVGIIGIVLDAVVPVAQQVGKNKRAKSGLERAIAITMFMVAIRTVPRLVKEVRTLRAQIQTPVAS
jgi:hypothetical protein